jgi:hypothetical protein
VLASRRQLVVPPPWPHSVAFSYGFAADLVADNTFGYNLIDLLNAAWRTNGTTGLFDKGDVFDETSGIFTAPVSGAW